VLWSNRQLLRKGVGSAVLRKGWKKSGFLMEKPGGLGGWGGGENPRPQRLKERSGGGGLSRLNSFWVFRPVDSDEGRGFVHQREKKRKEKCPTESTQLEKACTRKSGGNRVTRVGWKGRTAITRQVKMLCVISFGG